jgi:hypothetical protein
MIVLNAHILEIRALKMLKVANQSPIESHEKGSPIVVSVGIA